MSIPRQNRLWTHARAAITKALGEAGERGMVVADLLDATGMSHQTVEIVCPLMVKDGTAQWLADPIGRASNRRRYFAPDVVAYVAPKPPKPEKVKREKVAAELKPKKSGRPQKALTISEPKGAKRAAFEPDQPVTRAPGFRFTRLPGFERVTDVQVKAEPYFSALAVGSYLSTGSAIERALEARA